MQSRADITQRLQSWNEGDQSAIEKLVPLVYDELYPLAQRYITYERYVRVERRERLVALLDLARRD
jgi:hypothetical protein